MAQSASHEWYPAEFESKSLAKEVGPFKEEVEIKGQEEISRVGAN